MDCVTHHRQDDAEMLSEKLNSVTTSLRSLEEKVSSILEGQTFLEAKQSQQFVMHSEKLDSLISLVSSLEQKVPAVKGSEDCSEPMQKQLSRLSHSLSSMSPSPTGDTTVKPDFNGGLSHISHNTLRTSNPRIQLISFNSTLQTVFDKSVLARNAMFMSEGSALSRCWAKMKKRELLDFVAAVVILANSVCTGIEIEASIRGDVPLVYKVLENCFLVIFIIELSLNIYIVGIKAFPRNPWLLFDSIIVALGVLSEWVLTPILGSVGSSVDSTGRHVLESFTVLRVFRILRLVRVLRLIKFFQTMWRLLHSILRSLGVIFSMMIMMLFFMYPAACIGVEIITKNRTLREDPEMDNLVFNHFTHLPMVMVTLTRFVVLDNISEIYEPMIFKAPFLVLYFMSIGMFISISLMNIITAELVQNTMDISKRDNELRDQRTRRKARKLLPALERLFDRLDKTGSGYISLHQVELHWEEIQGTLSAVQDKFQVDRSTSLALSMSAKEFLSVIDLGEDVHGSPVVAKDGFLEALFNVVFLDFSDDIARILQNLYMQRKYSNQIRVLMEQLRETLDNGIMLRSTKEPDDHESERTSRITPATKSTESLTL